MVNRSNMEQIGTGELYDPADPAILAVQEQKLDAMFEFNHTRPSDKARRWELMHRMLAEAGEDCHIEAPFYANWGGANLHLGKKVYINFNLTIVDDVEICIGDYTMIGPNVTMITGTHPVDPALRGASPMQYNLPIHIGSNCWIGSGVTIMPGVTIGDNTVIGAGSLVTKDVPANVLAFGSPCRVIREIGEEEKKDLCSQ